MSNTNTAKELRLKRKHLFNAFIHKHNASFTKACIAVIKLTGGLKGIELNEMQKAFFDTEYKPYQDSIFEGAIEAGAPIRTVKRYWGTVGKHSPKQVDNAFIYGMENQIPVSLAAYMQPFVNQAKSRSERRVRDSKALERKTSNKTVLNKQANELTPAQKAAITRSQKSLNKWSKINAS